MANSNDKFQTLHPDPKKRGANISREKYDQIRSEIIGALRKSELSHTQLTNQIKSKLKKTFGGSVPWYVETVKLDLEARGKIERDGSPGQDVYKLKK